MHSYNRLSDGGEETGALRERGRTFSFAFYDVFGDIESLFQHVLLSIRQ